MNRGLVLLVVTFVVLSLAMVACAPTASTPEKPSAKPAEAKPAEKTAEKPAAPKAAEAKPAEAPADKAVVPKPAAKAGPIKVGYLTPLTGVYAAPGADMRDGFLLYVIQKGNQLAGRPVEVLVEETEGKPEVALTKAKKVVERDNVHMLAGILDSGEALSVGKYAADQKILLLINNAGADDLTQKGASRYTFRNSFANSQSGHPVGEWAYKKGFRKAAILAADYAAGWEWSGGFARVFTNLGGSIVQELYPALGAPDPSPFITSIKSDVDVVYSFQAGADAPRTVKAFADYGLSKKMQLAGVFGLTDDVVLPEEGDAALGVITSGGYTTALDTPANKAFVDAYTKRYNRPPTVYSEQAYSGAMMLDKALLAVQGSVESKEAFIDALEKVEISDAPRGPIKFDKYHNVVMNVYITEVKKIDGKLVNAVIETHRDISQFWKWGPDEYLKMPVYSDMKGKWAK